MKPEIDEEKVKMAAQEILRALAFARQEYKLNPFEAIAALHTAHVGMLVVFKLHPTETFTSEMLANTVLECEGAGQKVAGECIGDLLLIAMKDARIGGN